MSLLVCLSVGEPQACLNQRAARMLQRALLFDIQLFDFWDETWRSPTLPASEWCDRMTPDGYGVYVNSGNKPFLSAWNWGGSSGLGNFSKPRGNSRRTGSSWFGVVIQFQGERHCELYNVFCSYRVQDIGVKRALRLQTSKVFCTQSGTPVQSNVS